jgi:hypothetical protein
MMKLKIAHNPVECPNAKHENRGFNSDTMSGAVEWNFFNDASMTRAKAESDLQLRDSKRNRATETGNARDRPTFLARCGRNGEPVISYWDAVGKKAVHVTIQTADGRFSSQNSNGESKTEDSLEALLIALNYIDQPRQDESSNYVPFLPAVGGGGGSARTDSAPDSPAAAPSAPAKYNPPPSRSRVNWVINSSDLVIGEVLGAGQFGEVRKGALNGGHVAVKQLKAVPNRSAAQAAKAMTDLATELAIMQSLPWHQNVVQCRGAIVDAAGAPTAIVVEFCSAGSLLSVIDSVLWEQWKATKTRIVLGIARGVEHLHAHKIIHRDLAARNILVVVSGDSVMPKVTDFGMSRAVDDAEATNLTIDPVGPLCWMAPEQFHQLAYSMYSDVYSFGCVVFEVFMRAKPWKGAKPADVVRAVLADKRPTFSKECKIPSAVEELTAKCWLGDKHARPSMQEVREELELIAAQLHGF